MEERGGDKAAAAVASAGKAALEPQLVYLTVAVGDPARVPGLEVHRDGEELPVGAWGVAIPVDPGPHDVSAKAPGRKSWSATETITANATVAVPTLEAEAVAPAGGPDTSASQRKTQRALALVSGGLGVVGIGVATYFAFHAIAEKSDYRAHLTSAGQCADPTCQTDSHAAYVAGNVATGGFIAGGAFLAAGVALFLSAPAAPHAGSATLVPIVGPRVAGAGVTASW